MPGAEEVALFDRMGQLILGEDPRFDLVIFDTAPTGHTLRLIRMPELMEAWVRALTRSRRAMLGVEGDDQEDPILKSLSERFERLQALRARLVGGRTTAFVLVLIPERLPIEETARALTQLDDTGVRVGGLVVNRVLPAATTDAFLSAARPGTHLPRRNRAPLRRPPARRAAAVSQGRLRTGQPRADRRCAAGRHRSAPHDDRQAAARGLRPAVPGLRRRRRHAGRRRPRHPRRSAGAAHDDGLVAEAKAGHRYADGKWTRARGRRPHGRLRANLRLSLAANCARRRDAAAGVRRERLPVDPGSSQRSLAAWSAELRAVRNATLPLVRSLDAAALDREGTASNKRATVRGMAWVTAGHLQHHANILKDRYGM